MTKSVPADRIDEELAALAWAVAHPVRVRILRILIERGSCVCGELVEELPVAQSTVSQHLKVLKAAGLIRGEIEGPKVCYCVNPVQIHRLDTMFSELAKSLPMEHGGSCCG